MTAPLRGPGWDVRLNAFIEEGLQANFQWGTHDPVAWVVRCIDRCCDYAPVRPSNLLATLPYTSAETFAVFAALMGTAANLLTEFLGLGPPASPPHNRSITRGDPVVYVPDGVFGQLWVNGGGGDAFAVLPGIDGLQRRRMYGPSGVRREPGALVWRLGYKSFTDAERAELLRRGVL